MKPKQGKASAVAFFLVVAAVAAFAGLPRRTAEVRGTVFDEATGKPVAGAWIIADADVLTEGMMGGAYKTVELSALHTRTGDDGGFVISARGYGSRFFSTVTELRIRVFAEGGRAAFVKYVDAELDGFLPVIWGSKDVVLRAGLGGGGEAFEFANAWFLGEYCYYNGDALGGPVGSDSCDAWELDFLIAGHERYFRKYKDFAPEDRAKASEAFVHRKRVLEALSQLYKRKGDYKKAAEILVLAKENFSHRKKDAYYHESVRRYDWEIEVLERMLGEAGG